MPPFPASAAGPGPAPARPGIRGPARVPRRTSSCAPRRSRRWTHRGLGAARLGRRPGGRAGARPGARPGSSILRLSTPARDADAPCVRGHGRRRPGAPRPTSRLARQPRGLGLLLRRASPAAQRHREGGRAARPRRSSRAHGGTRIPALGRTWYRTRFRSPYLRNALWDAGLRARTRSRPRPTGRACPRSSPASRRRSRPRSTPSGERVHVFTHLSHLYPSGSSLYVTYIFRLAADPDETLDRWRAIKRAASDSDRRRGRDDHATTTASARTTRRTSPPRRARWGWRRSRPIVRTFDPDGLMNPGVLLSDRHG